MNYSRNNFFERYFICFEKGQLKCRSLFRLPIKTGCVKNERTNPKTTFDSFFFQGYLFLKTVLQNASFFISHKMQSFREWKMFFFKRTFQNMENNGGYFECNFKK